MSSPEYKLDAGRPLKYLDVSSTFDAKSKTVYLNVLNRSEKNDIAARVLSSSGAISSAVGVWELNHSDLKTTHTFGEIKGTAVHQNGQCHAEGQRDSATLFPNTL